MAGINYNDREARRAKRYRRHNYLNPSPWNNTVVNITVPPNVERREESAPCTFCGVARGCRHRPWLLEAAHG